MDESDLLLELIATLPAEPGPRLAAVAGLDDEVDHFAAALLTTPANSHPPAHRDES
ncbi:hypothetical protein [Humisphaera borealis]|uniref:Uncharacterized protein n=1 Tax=Humisphaera borealis TaxID=2807512 RepID=A0A7M2X332_9BACT|nr:hypothetical protein [Humisphaera borealis]QOV92084.1 hypothetical protein IPV69_12315 [Humisphaera borealis]